MRGVNSFCNILLIFLFSNTKLMNDVKNSHYLSGFKVFDHSNIETVFVEFSSILSKEYRVYLNISSK